MTLKYLGRYLLSSRHPQEQCRKILEHLPREEGVLYFIPSPLFGYHLSTWADSWGPGCHGVIMELEKVLVPFTTAENPRQFSVLQNYSEKDLAVFFRDHPPGTFRKVKMVPLTAGSSLHGEKYNAMAERLESEITHHWQNRSTLMFMAPLYLKNLWMNLQYLESRPVSLLPKINTSPVVVMGAGESLEPLLPDLKKNRQDFYLVVADTALPILREAEIYPDAVVVLEAQFHNLADFQGYPWEKTELWGDLTAHPKTFRLPWKGIRIFLSQFSHLKLLERFGNQGIPLIPPRGSVGLTALEQALRLGTGPVGIAGLDFAFRSGKSHARGAPGLARKISHAWRLSTAETPPENGLVPLPVGQKPQTNQKQKLVTTKVLRSYGLSAAGILQDYLGRVLDLRTHGMDLGLRPGRLEDLRKGQSSSSDMGEVTLPTGKILRQEAGLLSQLWDDFESLNHFGTLPPGFSQRLAELDYLWAAFPDADRLDFTSPTTLARIKASLAFHWHYLGALQS